MYLEDDCAEFEFMEIFTRIFNSFILHVIIIYVDADVDYNNNFTLGE